MRRCPFHPVGCRITLHDAFGDIESTGTSMRGIESLSRNNGAVFLTLLGAGTRGETSRRPRFTKSATDVNICLVRAWCLWRGAGASHERPGSPDVCPIAERSLPAAVDHNRRPRACRPCGALPRGSSPGDHAGRTPPSAPHEEAGCPAPPTRAPTGLAWCAAAPVRWASSQRVCTRWLRGTRAASQAAAGTAVWRPGTAWTCEALPNTTAHGPARRWPTGARPAATRPPPLGEPPPRRDPRPPGTRLVALRGEARGAHRLLGHVHASAAFV
jgi:hypothetical protein